MKHVLMQGYYGKANFGDDVLMCVTYAVVKRALPDAQIALVVEAADGEYVASLLPEATLLRTARGMRFDLIVHGGGGVFFDFQQYGLLPRMKEAALGMMGQRGYLAAESALRCLLGKPRVSATHRVGLGIGVGNFSAGSPRVRQNLAVMADFDALWLRDAESPGQLQRFAAVMTAERIAGSDLAFLSEHWLPASVEPLTPSARPRLGVALRDWPDGPSAEVLHQTIAALSQTYDITGLVLDQAKDPVMQHILAPYTQHVWHPKTMSIAQFAAHLGAQDVLLTSRAHGAICGACLGVPSVIVDIEPKMGQVHSMLANSSILVEAHGVQSWHEALERARVIPDDVIAADVEQNRNASEAALKQIARWLA